jgi:fatty acid synthase
LLVREIENGNVKPITYQIFDACDVSKAFYHMSTGKHTGKLLIKMREDENDEASLPICVQPRVYCNPEHSYIMVGGLGGLGLEFAQWLMHRKCRKVLFSSSRGVSSRFQEAKIK